MAATELKTQAIANAAITQPKLAPGVGGNTDHSFHLQSGVGTSVPNVTQTLLGWDTEVFDTDNLHDNVTNNSRVTITSLTAGKWFITGIVVYPNSPVLPGGAEVNLKILKNSATVVSGAGGLFPPVSDNHHKILTTIISLAAGDFIELSVRHTYGSTQTIGNPISGGRSHFQGIRIAT